MFQKHTWSLSNPGAMASTFPPCVGSKRSLVGSAGFGIPAGSRPTM
jgi:hypothetical protein